MTELQHHILHGIAYFTIGLWLCFTLYLICVGISKRRNRKRNPYLASTDKLAKKDR